MENTKKENPWLLHVKNVKSGAGMENMKFKDILKEASKTYDKNAGKGIPQKVINTISKIPGIANEDFVPAKDGELHIPGHNFSGPGTNIEDRIHVKPTNAVDACSKIHDIDYSTAELPENAEIREKLVREADLQVMSCYRKSFLKNPLDAILTHSVFVAKNKLLEDLLPRKINETLLGNFKGRKIKKSERDQLNKVLIDHGPDLSNLDLSKLPKGIKRSKK